MCLGNFRDASAFDDTSGEPGFTMSSAQGKASSKRDSRTTFGALPVSALGRAWSASSRGASNSPLRGRFVHQVWIVEIEACSVNALLLCHRFPNPAKAIRGSSIFVQVFCAVLFRCELQSVLCRILVSGRCWEHLYRQARVRVPRYHRSFQ